MRRLQDHESPLLVERGIDLRGVLAVSALPESVRGALGAIGPDVLSHAQLLVFGHAGTRMWRALTEQHPPPWTEDDPIDDYALRCVREHLERELHVTRYEALFPGPALVPLQELGALLGWHQPSPLRVGISQSFGTWFAYRAVVVADTDLPLSPTPAADGRSPCDTCVAKPCLSACLGSALTEGTLSLDRCATFRTRDASPCALRCPAREACPVAAEHRYDDAQIRYHYGVSLDTIRRYAR